MKTKDISGKTEKDLQELLQEKRQELFNLKLDNKMNKLKLLIDLSISTVETPADLNLALIAFLRL